jgi:hypothetical protein
MRLRSTGRLLRDKVPVKKILQKIYTFNKHVLIRLIDLFEGSVVFLVDEVLYKGFVLFSQRLILRLVQLLDVPEGFVPGNALYATL